MVDWSTVILFTRWTLNNPQLRFHLISNINFILPFLISCNILLGPLIWATYLSPRAASVSNFLLIVAEIVDKNTEPAMSFGEPKTGKSRQHIRIQISYVLYSPGGFAKSRFLKTFYQKSLRNNALLYLSI